MARGDSTQEKLLKAAINLFHEFGYNGTSVQDIVSAAKVPKGSFYNYFKSNEALAIAASDIFYPYARSALPSFSTKLLVGSPPCFAGSRG
jgi:AcrR family transcriptional regulator